MKISKATASLILLLSPSGHHSNCVAASTYNGAIPSLKGATPTYNLDKYNQDNRTVAEDRDNGEDGIPLTTGFEVEAMSDISYTYSLRINATLPLELDRLTGKAKIDECLEWNFNSNPDNFTWYGLRVQLPDDAVTLTGSYGTDVARATKELGLVQQYNATSVDTLLQYNITTKEAQPIIRINFNDHPFWETYTFDFVDEGSVLSDGSNYQEFTRTMNGAVSCYTTPSNESSRTIISPVTPTLTISLQRFGGGGGGDVAAEIQRRRRSIQRPPHTPPQTSAAVTLRGKLTSLGLATFCAASAFLF